MLVKESIDFKRGIGSKPALGVGTNHLIDSIMKNISGDYQFDLNDEDYLGFLNVDGADFTDPNKTRAYQAFIKSPEDFEDILIKYDLSTEETPSFDETVFIKTH